MCPFSIRGKKDRDGKWKLQSSGTKHNHSTQYLGASVPTPVPSSTSHPNSSSPFVKIPPPSRSQPQSETFRIPAQPIHRPPVPSYSARSASQQTMSFEVDLLSFLRSVQPDNPHNPALAHLLVKSLGIDSFDVLCNLLAMEDSTVQLLEGELASMGNGIGKEFGLRAMVSKMRSEL